MLGTLQDRRSRTADDKELAERLAFAVEQGPLALKGLSFYVHDGSVAIYGTVPSETLREEVLGLIAEQSGVKRITDHLRRTNA